MIQDIIRLQKRDKADCSLLGFLAISTNRVLWVRLGLVLILNLLVFSASAAKLSSPWDVLPKSTALRSAECPTANSLSPDLTASSYYKRSAKGPVVDKVLLAEYQNATAPFWRAANKVVSLSDLYRSTGNIDVAYCVANFLNKLAASNTLAGRMRGPQAEYVRVWMLNAYATSWLKVRGAIPEENRAQKNVPTWLAKLSGRVIEYYEPRNRKNNLRYWAGLAVMSASIAADRQDLFNWALASYDVGIDEIKPDGTLPLEMERGNRAAHYHNFAAAPLVLMAELANENGLNLYSKDDYAIKRLVNFIIRLFSDSSGVVRIPSLPQNQVQPNSSSFAWLYSYAKRFPGEIDPHIFEKFDRRDNLYMGGVVP